VQALNLADRKILDLFVTRAEVGIYQLGYTFGSTVKFPLSAFEPAWQPFVYAQVRRPDAPAVLARVATWAFASFLAVCLAVAVLGGDLLVLMTPKNPPSGPPPGSCPWWRWPTLPRGVPAGLDRDRHREARALLPDDHRRRRRHERGRNFLLIPRFGIVGAAWATVPSYAVMAGLGVAISPRLYPVPFENGRLAALWRPRPWPTAARSWPPRTRPGLLVKLGLLAAFVVVAGVALRRRDAAAGVIVASISFPGGAS
jgi:hypothetical protein